MRLTRRIGPYWRYDDTARGQKYDVLLCCALLLIPQTVRFGLRPVLLTLACAGIGVLTELICCLIYRIDAVVTDLDSITIGVLCAMLHPANVALYVPATAVVFAIAVAKMPFGGTGRTPLNPGAVGLAFATICFSVEMFTYPDLTAGTLDLNLIQAAPAAVAQSPAALLNSGARPNLLLTELLSGAMVGPIGTTVTVVTVAAALFLVVRRTINYRIPLCWVLGVAVAAALFPRVSTGRLDSVLIELFTGSIVFYGIFLLGYSASAPKLPVAQCLYGFVGGLIAMMYRYQGVFEQGGCFTVLLMNAAGSVFDQAVWRFLYAKKGGTSRET